MDLPMSDQPAIAVTIEQQGQDLRWRVSHGGGPDAWVFLLTPTIEDGRQALSLDTPWVDVDEDGTVVLRKAEVPVPPGVDVDTVVHSGAVLLKPGGTQEGRVALGAEVQVRRPYGPSGQRVPVVRVVMEVGWVPSLPTITPALLEWQGLVFAYLHPGAVPGGQQLARSAPLDWKPSSRP
jgi:hypothetical protein